MKNLISNFNNKINKSSTITTSQFYSGLIGSLMGGSIGTYYIYNNTNDLSISIFLGLYFGVGGYLELG